MTSAFLPFSEPWLKTAARTGLLAVAIGAGVGLLHHRPALIFPATLFALWFTLGGHFLELIFRNYLRQRIPPTDFIQLLTRLAYWFMGGSALYAAALTTAQALRLAWPSGGRWWVAGLVFLAAELLIHAMLAARGQASIYNGRG